MYRKILVAILAILLLPGIGLAQRGHRMLQGKPIQVVALDENVETLAGTKTFLITDSIVQKLDPDGDRDVILPAEASSDGLIFEIYNTANAGDEVITVKDDGAVTIGTIYPGEKGTYHCDATIWIGSLSYPDSGTFHVDGVALSTTIDGAIMTGGTNTFDITNGTASLNVAADAVVNIDKGLTVDGQAVTISGITQANTITLNESITVGGGNDGTLTYSAASKTLTVEDNATVSQDYTSDASPTFLNLTLGNNTDVDSSITFDGDSSNGVLNYDEDNADFEFNQDVSTTATLAANGAVLTGGTNTFNIANGTASLDVAASAAVNIDTSLTVDGQAVTISGVTQGNTITLNESFTVGGGFDVTISAEDAAGSIVLDNVNFEVEDATNAGNTIKIINANDDTTKTISLSEDLTVGAGANFTLTAEDTAGSIVLDEQTFEVEGEGTGTRLFKLVNAEDADRTLTFNEDLTIGDGDAITITLSSPVVDQVLRYNGSEWVNELAFTSGAGPGVLFYMDDTSIIATGGNNDNELNTLSKTPITTSEVQDDISCTNAASPVQGHAFLYDIALGASAIEAGEWDFDTYVAVSSTAARVSSITRNIYHVVVETETMTTTGSGTSRTATASGGTPFVAGDANATNTSAGYIQTPQGLYQITAFTNGTTVTIETPNGYSNESGAAFSTWKRKFGVSTGAISSIEPIFELHGSMIVQSAISIAATDKLAEITFAVCNNTTTVSFTHNGNERFSHFHSPLVTRHNDLPGLNAGDYKHLTSAEYSVLGDVTSVGDCSGGACLDGSSDGGTSISIYDGDSHKITLGVADLGGDLAVDIPITLTTTNFGYMTGLTSAVQTQLDARALESVVGTSIGGGIILDSTTLKTSTGLQSLSGLTLTAGDMAIATGANAWNVLDHGETTEIIVGGGAANPVWGTDLPTAVTIGSGYVYRAGGTDVAAGDMVTASDSAQGASELATDGETITGTATDRVVTPANITALHAGADIDRGGYYFTGDQGQVDGNAKGPGYFLSGDGTYIELADNANLDMSTNGFSVEIGFTPSNVTDTGKRLISKTDGTTGFEIVINEDDLQVAVLDNANNVTLTNLATGIFSAGKRSHIEVTFDRDGDIQAYHGGKPVGTPVSCTATATIANASVLRIGTETGGTTNEFNGEINKVRIRNLVSTSDEASENYSDSAVPFKYIGASQTAIGSFPFAADLEGWTKSDGGATATWVWDTDHGVLAITSAGALETLLLHSNVDNVTDFIVGKSYSILFNYTVNSGTCVVNKVHYDSTTSAIINVALSGSGTFRADFDDAWSGLDDDVRIYFNNLNEFNLSIDNINIIQTGCVLQLEQSGIGHGQWIDVSGNEGHGTNSGAIPINLAANHREKYVDLTLTGNNSFTLYKGYKITSITVFETAGNALTGGIDIGYTAGNGTDLVSGTAVGANAFVNLGLTTAAVLGATHLTADDILYFSDGDDNGTWDSAVLEVRVEMERLTVN